MRRYGWYKYTENPWRMVNFKSDQSLALQKAEHKKLSGHIPTKAEPDSRPRFIEAVFPKPDYLEYSTELTFLYKDNEIEHLVYFSILYQKDKYRSFGITINYPDWLEKPSYGLWRRLDDFLTDAALCWPEGIFEERPFGLTVVGAWFQGEWNPHVKRKFSGRKSGTPTQLEGQYVSDPFLVPLDAEVPLQWRYVDNAKAEPEVSLEFDKDNSFEIPYIPKDQDPSGFQGKTPYLIRSDNNAVIFLSKLKAESHRGEDPETHLYYTFVDQDIFFTFRSCPSYKLETSSLQNYGVRKIPPEKNLYPANIFGAEETFSKNFVYPSYLTWRKTLNVLMDAWPNWEKGKRVEIDASVQLSPNYGRVGYIGNYGPSISHGFCGGYSNNWYQVDFETPKMQEEMKNIKWVKVTP